VQITEKESGESFAIDSSGSTNGENPTVQPAASFYVPDTLSDNKPPETSNYAFDHGGGFGYAESDVGSIR
jgi:hypothetical protein